MDLPPRPAALAFIVAAGLSCLATAGCRPAPGSCSVPSGGDLARFEPICQLLDEERVAVREATVLLGDESGRLLTWTRGDLPPERVIDLASASKWMAAATLLRVVEAGSLRLEDRPQDHLAWATDDEADPRSRITLAHLLAFTSGLEVGPFQRSCVSEPQRTLQDCARELYDEVHEREPGAGFYYGPAHLQLAAAMAEVATGRSFTELFRDEVALPLGLSAGARFASPSETNPRVSGGGAASAEDYERFLLALLRGEYLQASQPVMHADHTPAGEVEIISTPIEPVGLEWHYAFGNWRECPHETWEPSCDEQVMSSSPGAFGFTPWIDWETRTWGVIAVKRSIVAGPARDSVLLAMQVRPRLLEALDLR